MFMKLEWRGEQNCRELKRKWDIYARNDCFHQGLQEVVELVYVGKRPAARHGETGLEEVIG